MCSTVCTSDLCVQLQVSPDQICCLVSSAGEDMRRHSQDLDFEQVSHCTCIWMTFWSFLPPVNYSDHTLSFWRPCCHSGFTAVQPQESPKVTYLCSFLFFIYLQKVSSPSSQAKTWRHERSTLTPGPLQPSGPAVAIVDDAAADVIKFLNEYGTTIRVSSSGLWQNVNKEWQFFFSSSHKTSAWPWSRKSQQRRSREWEQVWGELRISFMVFQLVPVVWNNNQMFQSPQVGVLSNSSRRAVPLLVQGGTTC